jgi:hypothetical protein
MQTSDVLSEREHMKRVLLAAVIVAGIICGCVPSIHGIATKDNMVWNDDLVGTWGEPNDPNKTVLWRFDKGDVDKTYSLIYVDERAKVGRFDVALVKLGDFRFLDIYPKDLDDEMNSFYKGHWIPAHTFAKVSEIDDKLRVRLMDPDKMKKLLDKEPNLLKHETVDDAILLTAGTSEILEFIKKHLEDVWSDETTLVRKK